MATKAERLAELEAFYAKPKPKAPIIRRTPKDKCFYCGALVRLNCERDHFPIPASAGGVSTVPSCISCHDMKDRFNLDDWPEEWVQKTIADFPLFSRETRLFLAVAMRIIKEPRPESFSVQS